MESDPARVEQHKDELEAAYHTLELKRKALKAQVQQSQDLAPHKAPPPIPTTATRTATPEGAKLVAGFGKHPARAPSPARTGAAPYQAADTFDEADPFRDLK